MLKYCPLASMNGENYRKAVSTGWRFLITPQDLSKQMPTVLHTVKKYNYAIDNGAWTAQGDINKWDSKGFFNLLVRFGPGADFTICPDVVGNAKQTFELSAKWALDVSQHCEKVLFSVQDGMEQDEVYDFICEHAIYGIFIGGSTEFKINTLPIWSQVCKKGGLYLHVGRVNTAKRLNYCEILGADSFDGSGVIKFKKHMDFINQHIQNMNMQPFLTGVV